MAAIVAAASLVVSGAVGSALAREQRESADEQLERRATLVAEAVANETVRYVDTLRTVAAALGGFEPLTATTFTRQSGP